MIGDEIAARRTRRTRRAEDRDVLDRLESSRLVELEEIVTAGRDAFVEVGRALMEIRDRRLYRETHATFAAYLVERWEISESRGYQLIDSYSVSTIVEVENEAQARELAGLNAEQAAAVYAAALQGTGARVTARALGEARQALLPPRKKRQRRLKRARVPQSADVDRFGHLKILQGIAKDLDTEREAFASLIAEAVEANDRGWLDRVDEITNAVAGSVTQLQWALEDVRDEDGRP
jgi:hypothetical protein